MTKPETDPILNALKKKFEAINQKTNTHLEGLLWAKPLNYWDYIQTAIKNDSIKQYDYLLLNLKVDEDHKIQLALLQQQLPGYQLEKEFFGYKNKKEIIIYKKSPNKQSFTSSN